MLLSYIACQALSFRSLSLSVVFISVLVCSDCSRRHYRCPLSDDFRLDFRITYDFESGKVLEESFSVTDSS